MERAEDQRLEAWVQVLTLFFSCVTMDKSVFEVQCPSPKRRCPKSLPTYHQWLLER